MISDRDRSIATLILALKAAGYRDDEPECENDICRILYELNQRAKPHIGKRRTKHGGVK